MNNKHFFLKKRVREKRVQRQSKECKVLHELKTRGLCANNKRRVKASVEETTSKQKEKKQNLLL
jgi:hypothetical protein